MTRNSGAEDTPTRTNLTQRASVDDVVALLEDNTASYIELISTDAVNDHVYTTGYLTHGRELSSRAYTEAISATYLDIANELERDGDASGAKPDADALRALASELNSSTPRIVAVVTAGSRDGVASPSPYSAREETNDASSPVPIANTIVQMKGPEDAGSGGNCNNAWWPWTGRISTQYSSSVPNRYVWQRFKWSQWRIDNLYDCDGFNTSYEHEAWFNNYDDSLFLSSSVQTWSSTLPDAYLDTGFLDGDGELSLTIGTGAAYQLDANVNYTTYIRTAPGNATTDSGKVNGQRGLNLCPIGLTGGWCVFARETEKLLPAWNHTVPGANNWTHT